MIKRILKPAYLSLILGLSLTRTVQAATAPAVVRRGNQFFAEQKYGQALEKYQQALQKRPESGMIHFNAGAARYRLGEYAQAAEDFRRALLSEDPDLVKQAHYNLGNSLFRQGQEVKQTDPQKTSSLWQESIQQYEQAMQLAEDHEDARFNRDYVQKVLEQLKQQMQQDQDQKQQQQQQGQQKEEQDGQSKQDQQDPRQKNGQQQKRDQQDGQRQQQNGRRSEEEDQKQDGEQQGRRDQGQEEQKRDQSSPEQKAAASGREGEQEDLSRRQARRLLEEYEQNEQPKGLLNLQGEHDSRPVLKDW